MKRFAWKSLLARHAEMLRVPPFRKGGLVAKELTAKALRDVFDVVAMTVLHGGRVVVPGFGTFELREHKERRIRDYKTKEFITVPAHQVIGFKMSPQLRRWGKWSVKSGEKSSGGNQENGA